MKTSLFLIFVIALTGEAVAQAPNRHCEYGGSPAFVECQRSVPMSPKQSERMRRGSAEYKPVKKPVQPFLNGGK